MSLWAPVHILIEGFLQKKRRTLPVKKEFLRRRPDMKLQQSYTSDLTNQAWLYVLDLISPKRSGRPRKWSARVLLNAIFYIVRNAPTWRQLPHDFPPWQTVYWHFRRWTNDGTWRAIGHRLFKELRRRLGRDENPSVVI